MGGSVAAVRFGDIYRRAHFGLGQFGRVGFGADGEHSAGRHQFQEIDMVFEQEVRLDRRFLRAGEHA